MTILQREPSIDPAGAADVYRVAYALAKLSAEQYRSLGERLAEAGRPRLALLLADLAAESGAQMQRLEHWGMPPQTDAALPESPAGLFDDDGIGTAPAEIEDAYHVYRMAVRNRDRAFAFWSYVAARASAPAAIQAAERLARQELERAKELRRKRRQAYHAQMFRRRRLRRPLAEVEAEVGRRLDAMARTARGGRARSLQLLADAAAAVANDLQRTPLAGRAEIDVPETASVVALADLLLGCYLDLGRSAGSESARSRAHALAEGAAHRLRLLREAGAAGAPDA